MKKTKDKWLRIFSFAMMGSYFLMVIISWALSWWKPILKTTLLELNPVLAPMIGIIEGMIFTFIGYRKKLKSNNEVSDVEKDQG